MTIDDTTVTFEHEDSPSSNKGIIFRPIAVLAVFLLVCMISIPLLEALGRRTSGFSIPGASGWVQHLTLWLSFLGAVLATMRGRHLAITVTHLIKNRRAVAIFEVLAGVGAVSVLLYLGWASYVLVKFQRASPETLGGWLPLWLAQAVMPVTFIIMAAGTILTISGKWKHRVLLLLITITITAALANIPESARSSMILPGLTSILLLAMAGMPLYAVLGGAAVLLFFSANVPIAAIPAETYRIVTQPVLPSIPLFALCGTILAAGGSPKRLIRFVRAWTGWLPGGAAISTVIVCAFFTAITGASGVTIIALGGLLLPVLLDAKFDKRFSTGLITASGSVGLLFPPSLPVILYGVYGHVAIDKLFIAAFLPGVLLLLMLASYCLYIGYTPKSQRPQFDAQEAVKATWHVKGDLMLPGMVLVGLFGGFMTLVETAALTALWAILLETVFYKELDLRRGLPNAIIESAIMVGALLIVIGVASGLASYVVDAQIPQKATDWIMNAINSKLVFLLVLNGMLLLVGALMDIFSAIVLVVPLIVPIGMAFGVDPIHLGIIFLANLELGYLTPPVGMNLFLSSLRFKQPLIEIWRMAIPFLFILAAWVLLIVYLPSLTSGIF